MIRLVGVSLIVGLFFTLEANAAARETATITPWTAYTPSITGTVSNPYVPSDCTACNFYLSGHWRRVGNSMEVMIAYNHSNTSGSAGSGTYLFSLPPTYQIDTASLYGGAFGPSLVPFTSVGLAQVAWAAQDSHPAVVYVIDDTHVYLKTDYGQSIGSTTGQLGYDPVYYSFIFSVPITGWSL